MRSRSSSRGGKAPAESRAPALPFYQLIHYGTSLIPCDFIAFAQSLNLAADAELKLGHGGFPNALIRRARGYAYFGKDDPNRGSDHPSRVSRHASRRMRDLKLGKDETKHGRGDLNRGKGDVNRRPGDLNHGKGRTELGMGGLNHGMGDLNFGRGDSKLGRGHAFRGKDDTKLGLGVTLLSDGRVISESGPAFRSSHRSRFGTCPSL